MSENHNNMGGTGSEVAQRLRSHFGTIDRHNLYKHFDKYINNHKKGRIDFWKLWRAHSTENANIILQTKHTTAGKGMDTWESFKAHPGGGGGERGGSGASYQSQTGAK